jgi:hypothetical protein
VLAFAFEDPGEDAAHEGLQSLLYALDGHVADRAKAQQARESRNLGDLFQGWSRLLDAREEVAAGGRQALPYDRVVPAAGGKAMVFHLSRPASASLLGEEWSVADYAQGRPLERGEVTAETDESIVLKFRRPGARIPDRGVLLPYLGPSQTSLNRTEVCEPDRPHVIVHVATTTAPSNDIETVTERHADLEAADLLPDQELVDAAYVSVDHILDAACDHGIDLVGPLPPDFSWRTRDPDVYGLTYFTIDWDQHHATCPTGAVSRNWREAHSADGLPIVQVTFRLPDCTSCPQRAHCTRSKTNARSVTFRPQRQFEAQQRLRAEQATGAWQEQYARRSGIQGTMSQASRRCDVHHARYKGLTKTHLQHVLTAMALNLVRIDAWLTGTPHGSSWTSRLETLRLSLASP